MKLAKKLLASRVNSVRPYKSRSKRPCDFCRRRKTCCIIENLIPCMACSQFNKGVCTFLEGPLKRRNRKASDPRAKRGRKKLEQDSGLPSGLDSGVDLTYVLSTLHESSATPLSGMLDSFLHVNNQTLYGGAMARGWSNTEMSPLAGTGFVVGTNVGAMSAPSAGGLPTGSSPMLGGVGWYGPMALGAMLAPLLATGAAGLLGLLGLGSVSLGNLGQTEANSTFRDGRPPESTLAPCHHVHGRASAPDIYLRQLTLSSASLWLDVPGYETLLSMLYDLEDAKRFSSLLYPPAQSYFQPLLLHHAPQLQLQTQAQILDNSVTAPTGWSYGDYVGVLSGTGTDSLALQSTFANSAYSQVTHSFASSTSEAVGEQLT